MRIHGIFLRVETQTLFDLLNDFSSCPRGVLVCAVFVVLSNVLRVRRDITDFPRVDAALSTNLGAVPFCRTLGDGRASTRGFFRLLPSSPAGSCPCKLRPFSILCVPDSPPCRQWISVPCAGNAPFHRIGTKKPLLEAFKQRIWFSGSPHLSAGDSRRI